MYELFKHGTAKSTPGDSITEGIGLGRVTPVIEDGEARPRLPGSRRGNREGDLCLLEHEGLCLGGSTGVNSPAPSSSRNSSDRARPSSPSSRIPATAISQNSSIPSSCARRSGAGMAGKTHRDRRAVREGVSESCRVGNGAFALCPPSINRETLGGHAPLCPPTQLASSS